MSQEKMDPSATSQTAPRWSKESYSKKERWLLLVALLLAVLIDRTVFRIDVDRDARLFGQALGGCALALLGAYMALNGRRLRWDGIAWALLASAVAMAAWMMAFFGSDWTMFSLLSLMASMMLYIQYANSALPPKRAGHFCLAVLAGYFVQPFRGVPHFFGALMSGNRLDRKVLFRVLAGAALALVLVCCALPLLMSADSVFDRMVTGAVIGGDAMLHVIGVAVLLLLIYSFLWCALERPEAAALQGGVSIRLDPLVCGIALGALLALYALFAGVQFMYLFARAGLPAELTYAEYARQGFAQMIAVVALNLAVFGLFTAYVPGGKGFSWMLGGLLAASALMVCSGIVRLNLYLAAYGMTEPRLMAYWALLLCGILVAVCAVRLVRANVPAVALCMVAALLWYGALAFANPDRIIETYNQTHVTLHQQLQGEPLRTD